MKNKFKFFLIQRFAMGKIFNLRSVFIVCFLIVTFSLLGLVNANSKVKRSEVLKIGKIMPNAQLKKFGQSNVEINDLKGKIKIVSIVPQLNTPVCDKQTHQFSEKNGDLDKHVDIITISTNTAEGQDRFAKKAKINNLIFLSDNPEFNFGKNTGLLIEGMGVLRRTVLVLDERNIIRYVDLVPGGGLPDIKGALKAARQVLLEAS